MEGGEDTTPQSDSLQLQFPHHDPCHPSDLILVARRSQPTAGGTDASEHRRTEVTQSDWNIHRETILYLYRDCMQPLNRVREIMEHDHGFFAT